MARFESAGTWFAAEEVAKRQAAQRFSVGDRVKYRHHNDPGLVWFGTVDTVYENGRSCLIRFEHDGQLRGRYYAEELEVVSRPTVIGVDMKTGRLVDIAELATDNSPIACLRRLYARSERQGLTRDQAFNLAQQYHYHVGALLRAPDQGLTLTPTQVADWLGRNGFLSSAYNVRTYYRLHGL